MSRLRVHSFAISVDGYGAGRNQEFSNPLGVGGIALHQWIFATRTFHQMTGREGGERGVDDDFMARGIANIGACIMGRNMFGPARGPWPDDTWRGWWGDNPPFHTPVFVLTNHPRPSITMKGGTTFHFIADGIHSALKRATAVANGQNVRLGGGVAINCWCGKRGWWFRHRGIAIACAGNDGPSGAYILRTTSAGLWEKPAPLHRILTRCHRPGRGHWITRRWAATIFAAPSATFAGPLSPIRAALESGSNRMGHNTREPRFRPTGSHFTLTTGSVARAAGSGSGPATTAKARRLPQGRQSDQPCAFGWHKWTGRVKMSFRFAPPRMKRQSTSLKA